MSSRKRSHPEDESCYGPSLPPPVEEEVKPVLAPREMFFSIPLRTIRVHGQPIQALTDPRGGHALANTRIAITASLNSLQRASLTTILTILNDYFPHDDDTERFTRSLTDTIETNDSALAALADKIDLGLIAFLAKGGGGGQHSTPDSDSVPSPASKTAEATSSTTAVAHKRARVSTKSGRSNRSLKIKQACKARDGSGCRLCNGVEPVSAHILPFSMKGRKTVDFWAFIAMFRGVAGTSALKAAALDPDPNNPDNLMNVIQLCRNCHNFLDKSLISLVPQILEAPATAISFPYDPREVAHYDVVVELPAGFERAKIPVLQADGDWKSLRPGQVLTLRTADPATLPLPHPLLLQLHVLCSRMAIMRAAAGYPILLEDESDGNTLFDPLEVGDDIQEDKECYGELGGRDESRDPEVVILELDQRKFEQEQLLLKIRGRADTVRPRVVI